MNILYAIQGTGNGHVSRAREIIPILSQMGNLDILISGTQADIPINYPIKYQCSGLGFKFGKKGGIDIPKSISTSKPFRFLKDCHYLPVHHYDVIFNDFEPITAWACAIANKFSIGISHQIAVSSAKSPKTKRKDWLGDFVLNNYAPCSVRYGFHFKPYDENIFSPIIRKEIRNAKNTNLGHFTVYLPAYSDKLIHKCLSKFKNTTWQVFSKHSKIQYQEDNIVFIPVNNNEFIRSLTTCDGVLCGGGFETPAEALFLNKKLMVIPMKNQHEQHHNAAALEEMGVDVIKELNTSESIQNKIKQWLDKEDRIQVFYPNQTKTIFENIIDRNYASITNPIYEPNFLYNY